MCHESYPRVFQLLRTAFEFHLFELQVVFFAIRSTSFVEKRSDRGEITEIIAGEMGVRE
jgi:hypothetical protein